MKKRILIALLGVILIIAALAGVKTLQIKSMIASGKNFVHPAETVTTATVKSEGWDSSLTATGSLTAVQGVTVAAEIPGKVVKISFEAGTAVKKGDLLIQQDTSSEEAQLPGAVAQATLVRNDLKRSEQMFAEGIISRADHEKTTALLQQAQSQVDNIRATIAKKMIRAPFSGSIGMRQVNLGQILREGDPIATLQTMDPVYVDFSIPQQQLARIRLGLPVSLSGDALGTAVLSGRITAINPLVDAETRNVKVQSTVDNKRGKLRPGMFVNVSVGLPTRQQLLVIPATAVLYAPYSDSVFVVEPKKDAKSGKDGLVLRQQFVRLGEKRGDFVAVTTGLKESETVVTTGVFKLRNGQSVTVDNKLSPNFQHSPKPENN